MLKHLLVSSFFLLPFCYGQSDWCPPIAAPFVQSVALQVDKTLDINSTLVCKQFVVPSDTTYHIIAWQPSIMSSNVDFINVFACDIASEEAFASRIGNFNESKACGFVPSCSSLIVSWVPGMPKRCYGSDFGTPMGKHFYKMAIVQVGYKEELKERDVAGIIIHFTPILRPNHKAVISVGQKDIAIPPGVGKTVRSDHFEGNCSVEQLSPHSTYRIVSTLFQTRRHDVYGRLFIRRNSTKITLFDRRFRQNQPPFIAWEGSEQIVLEPGDAIEVECGYDTSRVQRWNFWGDELCSVFVELYPQPRNRLYLNLEDLVSSALYKNNFVFFNFIDLTGRF